MNITTTDNKNRLYVLKNTLHVPSVELAITALLNIRDAIIGCINIWDLNMTGSDSDKPEFEDIVSKLHEIVDIKRPIPSMKKEG